MQTHLIAVLAGDGIGPEVTSAAVRVLEAVGERFGIRFSFSPHAVGAAAVAAAGHPLPADTRAAVLNADAALLGAVGDPALDHPPRPLRPESGLLRRPSLLAAYPY